MFDSRLSSLKGLLRTMQSEELDLQMHAALCSLGDIFRECSEQKGNDDESRRKQAANRRAFASALRIFADSIEHPPEESTREPYPKKWLRGHFVDKDGEGQREVSKGWLPLHFALTAGNVIVDDIQCLLSEVGEDAYMEDVSPLSVAVARPNPSSAVVKQLIDFKPDAINKSDKDGAYALMYSAAWNDCELTLHSLYTASPGAMQAIDKYGYHAIHFAAYVGCYDVCSYILHVYPECIKIKTSGGVLPLSAAVVNRTSRSTDIVQLMLDMHPKAAKQADEDGALPIHKAAQFGTLDTVKLLYNAYPEGMMIADGEGLLPMHYAGQRDKSREDNMEILQFLSEENEKLENESKGGSIARNLFNKMFKSSS